uniref:Uncharacterized protein n=1 Tax=Setaria italica TaxID=4555 RepID=K3YAL5_SETIT
MRIGLGFDGGASSKQRRARRRRRRHGTSGASGEWGTLALLNVAVSRTNNGRSWRLVRRRTRAPRVTPAACHDMAVASHSAGGGRCAHSRRRAVCLFGWRPLSRSTSSRAAAAEIQTARGMGWIHQSGESHAPCVCSPQCARSELAL